MLCEVCGLEMKAASSCVKSPISVDGKILDPVRYGEETHAATALQFRMLHPEWTEEQIQKAIEEFNTILGSDPTRCPDCNVALGGYHHPGCDIEECPSCHMQLIGCDCAEEAATA